MYKEHTDPLTGQKCIVDTSTNTFIPKNSANSDYQRVLDSIDEDGADAWDDTVSTYDDIPEDLRTASESKKFDKQLADYKAALARLDEYEVANGKAEETESVVVRTEWDFDTNAEVDVTETRVISGAIPAAEATVDVETYDEDGNVTGTTSIENPRITKDKEERAAAQAVVDATPQAVKDAV